MPVHTPASHGLPPVAELREELQMQVSSGRAAHYWSRPVREGLTGMLGEASLPLDVWAALDWYGPLDPFRSPEHEISDILFNGPPRSPLFIVQRGAMLDSGITLHPEWVTFTVRQLLLRSHKIPIDSSEMNPPLPPRAQGVADGMRYAVQTAPYVRGGSAAFSLRLLPQRWRTLDDLVQGGMITREIATLLITALKHHASVLVAGATGSGKTTLVAGVTQELGKQHRMVFVEDGGELPRCANSVHLDVNSEHPDEFPRAIRDTLRMRPSYTIVGEVRGGEAIAMLQAAATGHPGIGTIHASDVQNALRSLERNAMIGLAAQASGGGQAAAQIVRGLISSADLIVVHVGITARGRRVVADVSEVLHAGANGIAGDNFPCNPLFSYDPHQDAVVRRGFIEADWGRNLQI